MTFVGKSSHRFQLGWQRRDHAGSAQRQPHRQRLKLPYLKNWLTTLLTLSCQLVRPWCVSYWWIASCRQFMAPAQHRYHRTPNNGPGIEIRPESRRYSRTVRDWSGDSATYFGNHLKTAHPIMKGGSGDSVWWWWVVRNPSFQQIWCEIFASQII